MMALEEKFDLTLDEEGKCDTFSVNELISCLKQKVIRRC